MIVGLVVLAMSQAAAAPPPTGDDLLVALFEKAPGAEIVSVSLPTRPGEGIACGTARFGGVVEPFAVVARAPQIGGPVVTMTTPDGQVHQSPRDPTAWRFVVSAPYRASAADLDMSAHAKRQWDALARRQALAFCPRLTPPEGAVWVTEIEEDPSLTPEQRARARERARAATDLIFGPRPATLSED